MVEQLLKHNIYSYFCIVLLLWRLFLGGDTLVQSSRNIAWVSSLFYPGWCLVSGMHICRDDKPTTTFPRGLWDWWIV